MQNAPERMNDKGTCSPTDTPLARGGSRFELIDKDGHTWGQYSSAREAAEFAKGFWPDQEQDPDRTGHGWDIEAVR